MVSQPFQDERHFVEVAVLAVGLISQGPFLKSLKDFRDACCQPGTKALEKHDGRAYETGCKTEPRLPIGAVVETCFGFRRIGYGSA